MALEKILTGVMEAEFGGGVYPVGSEGECVGYFEEVLGRARGVELNRVVGLEPAVWVVPHIDFRVHMELYGIVYRRILEAAEQNGGLPETVIVLGVGHRCPVEFSSCPFKFKTVLGEVETDRDLWNEFQKQCQPSLANWPSSFAGEHSIEFVVIWLQALQRIMGAEKAPKILPVLMSGLHSAVAEKTMPGGESEIGQFFDAFKTVSRMVDPKKTCVIASIDGCHVGPRFDHPFGADEQVRNGVQAWEEQLWNLCRSDCFDEFFRHICDVQNAFYFDGVGVLSLLLKTFEMQVVLDGTALWYEDKDQSFVTFSGGLGAPLR